MTNDVQRLMDNVTAQAALTYLASYLQLSQQEVKNDPAGSIQAALAKLPMQGRLKGYDREGLLLAMDHVAQEIAIDDPRRAAILAAVASAR